MSDTPTLTLARYAASSSCSSLSAEVRDQAKKVIADEIACALFARRSLAGDLAARFAEQAGGAAEARIYATGKKVSAANAALANGAAGHGEEVDGAHIVGGHPGASIVHASVAMAERQRTTGAELVNAVTLGYEIGVRAVEACGGVYNVKNRFGLHSDFLYALGCASASARLLHLDANAHCHAMALASFASNGLCTLFAEKRHISKSLCNGQFAAAGVNGALMAAAGLEGHEDILAAPFGVLHAWGEETLRDTLTQNLGENARIMGANFKFVNAGYPIHAPVEAAIALTKEHGLVTEAIESVRIGMPTNSMKVVDGRDMRNICAQDMVTAAMLTGGLKLHELPFPQALSLPGFDRLRARVTLHGDPELDRDQPNGRGAIVRIMTADGKRLAKRVDYPKGHALRGPVSWNDLEAKWRELVPECDAVALVGIARRLDEIEDVTELLDAFRPA